MGRLNKEMIIGSFEKNKFIETSFNNEEDFNDAIENLKEANIDFIVTEKRIFYKLKKNSCSNNKLRYLIFLIMKNIYLCL